MTSWQPFCTFPMRHFHGLNFSLICFKFEQNRTKIATVRVPPEKNAKWPPWRHQIELSKIWEKWHWPLSSTLFVWNFIKIVPAVWVLKPGQSGRQTWYPWSILTYSFLMTEYKNAILPVCSQESAFLGLSRSPQVSLTLLSPTLTTPSNPHRLFLSLTR